MQDRFAKPSRRLLLATMMAPAVPLMYERLKAVYAKIGVDYEIIFVNDCSPDNADQVLAELAARDSRHVSIGAGFLANSILSLAGSLSSFGPKYLS